MKQRSTLFLLLSVLVLVAGIWSFMSLTSAAHKTLDQRVQEVGSQLKCPVCQSESVADSPSLLAQQMRGSIRQQLQKGKSEQEIIQYFVNNYGDGIAWSPPWAGFALLAWLIPIALLLGGIGLLIVTLREWRTSPASVNPDENELAGIDGEELERYRAQLELELAAEDPLFRHVGTEGGR